MVLSFATRWLHTSLVTKVQYKQSVKRIYFKYNYKPNIVIYFCISVIETSNKYKIRMFRTDSRLIQENDQENLYASYLAMEDLLDKLKVLNYDVEFVKELKMKPLNKYNIKNVYYRHTLISYISGIIL